MSDIISEKRTRPFVESFVENVRCTLIGDERVGKTSILLSYQADTYPSEYVKTEFDSYSKRTKYKDLSINLLLYDVGGQADLESFEKLDRLQTDVFLLCFSVDDRTSFENVSTKWLEMVKRCWLSPEDGQAKKSNRMSESDLMNPIVLLVGCKTDRKTDKSVIMKHSELVARPLVTSKEAVTLSKSIEAYKYMECSSRNGTGVVQIFTQVIKAVQERRNYFSSKRWV